MEGGIKLNFSITIPDRPAGFVIALTMLYRRARYGYAFRRIPLTQGKYAIVDPEDFERLNKYKWYAVKDSRTFYSYRNKRVGKKYISLGMHREILDPPGHLVVDHINHNGLDNRKANLRLATSAQEDRPAAEQKAQFVIEKLRSMKLGKAAEVVADGVAETMSYYAFPRVHWRQLRTNNPLERIMREIRRRTRVVGSFPDGHSALMLAAARLRHIAGSKWGLRCYMSMEHLHLQDKEMVVVSA